jgi:glucokinase
MEANKDSKMWEIAGSLENVDGRTAFDAMRAGDAAGTAVVDAYIYYVAVGLIDMINIFQPEILCVGGGICKEGDTLLVPLKKYIEAEHYSKHSDKQTRLTVAQLGNDAGVIGAACLVK